MKKLLLISFLMLSSYLYSQDYVGLYVNDFDKIIGNPTKETALLEYAQNNNFNYLILYRMHQIHTGVFSIDDPVESIPLSNFIYKAKINYGILQVAAVGEKNSSFDKIKIYNSFHTPESNKRFDVFNLEFEYWSDSKVESGGYYCTTYLDPNGYSCTINGATDFYIDQLSVMKPYGDANSILIEIYIGKIFTEADTPGTVTPTTDLVNYTDRILVHYYRQKDIYNSGDADATNDYSIYQYPSSLPDRIKQLAIAAASISTPKEVTVMPIFSARPSHMYDWLLSHPLTQPFDTYLNGIDGFNEQVGTWKDDTNINGYVWYRYSELLEINETLSLESQAFENENIYYNRKDTNIYFNNFNKMSKVAIFDINGKRLATFNLRNFYSIRNYSKGLYIIKVVSNNKIFNKKIIKQ